MKTEKWKFSERDHSIRNKTKLDNIDTIKTYCSHDWTIINAVRDFNPHAD